MLHQYHCRFPASILRSLYLLSLALLLGSTSAFATTRAVLGELFTHHG